MRRRVITLALIAVCGLLGFGATSKAEIFLVGKQPIAAMSFPDSWKVKTITRGLQGATKDDEVYVWAEIYPADGKDEFFAEHDAYYTKQGVEISSEDPKVAPITVNGVKAIHMQIAATWKKKSTVIEYVLFDPPLKSGRKMALSYWASPEGNKLYEADLDSILASVKFKAE